MVTPIPRDHIGLYFARERQSQICPTDNQPSVDADVEKWIKANLKKYEEAFSSKNERI